jgi:predicted dehydrogenase
LPGYQRDSRCQIVAIADTVIDRAREAAREFSIPSVASDAREVIGRGDVDLVDVCTPSHTHFDLAWAALEAGKHVLCEKPVAYDFRDTRQARELARARGL